MLQIYSLEVRDSKFPLANLQRPILKKKDKKVYPHLRNRLLSLLKNNLMTYKYNKVKE